MLTAKNKLAKRCLSLVLAFALVVSGVSIGGIASGSVRVAAETVEPAYNADTDVLLYENSSITMEAATSEKFNNTSVSENTTYYVTYTLKTDGGAYFSYRGAGDKGGRLYIGPTQYGLIGLETESWPQVPGLAKAENGVKVTICSTPDNITLYLNGEQVADQLPLATKGEAGVPSMYVDAAATLTDVKIWTVSDMPQYDEENDASKYFRDEIQIPAESKSDFGVKVPANVEYYVAFDVKTEGGLFFSLRGESDECRLYMDDHQYTLLGISDTETWPQKQTGLATGARITLSCSGDSVKVWLNGEKIAEETFSKNTGLKGCPGITWVTKDTTITNARVWIKGDAVLTDEPKYDETVNVLKVSQETINVEAQSKADFGVEIPSYQEYFMDFTVKSDSGVFISYRGEDSGRLYIDAKQYAVIGIGEEVDWVQQKNNLADGVRVTIQSSGKKVSIWLDGESIVKDAEMVEADGIGTPAISWANAATTITNLKVWTNKDEYSAQFNWSADYTTATVTITNANDSSDAYTYDAVVTKEEKTKATCTEKGLVTYTATYGGYSDSKDVVTDAKGHSYKAEFNWAADNKSAKVTVTCLNDASDVKTYDAKVTSAVTTKATYFAKGVTTYTATYDKFTDSKKVSNIAQLKLGTTKVTVKSPKKKRLKVSLKAVSGATSYEIQYSLKKNFKGVKKVTTKKKTYTIKKLQSKKKYYVRVRAIVSSGSNKVYGAWAKAKKAVKVK